MREDQLQASIAELCKYLGALIYHTHDSRRSNAGWPDCAIITRDNRLLVRELKVGRNKPSKAQQQWLDRLKAAGVDAGVWRDTDWPDRIKNELTPRPRGDVSAIVARLQAQYEPWFTASKEVWEHSVRQHLGGR